MRKLLCCAASTAALIFAASAADTAAPKKTPSKTTPAAAKTAVHSAATGTKTGVSTKNTASKTRTSHTAVTAHTPITSHTTSTTARTITVAHHPVTTWRNRQASPTTDRFKEIQDALVSKGYLQNDDATGRWDQTSVEAMKRFQAEQKLDSTGKINSLSLIALGLGPKYEAATASKPTEIVPNGQ